MNNKGESITKYNDLLIGYLNDLVNSVEQDTEYKTRTFEDVANRLRQQLSVYNINFSDDTIKLIMTQAFKAYADILKKHFDSSNIHRIDLNHVEDTSLTDEMNTVTSNLTNAVNNMNKISDYPVLIKKIKDSMVYHFRQNSPNYQNFEFEVEQILNDVVVGAINTFTSRKIEDFSRDTLPDLYKVCDELTRELNASNVSNEVDENVNEERDQFISDTMDIEIHEGFENGKVTLTVIDQMGNQQLYVGQEAMEKLTSYNQLFESSRPGKKADTSHWPKMDEVSNEQNNVPSNNFINNQVSLNDVNTVNNLNQVPNNNDLVNNQNNTPSQQPVVDEKNGNEQLIRNFLSKYNDDKNIANQNNSSNDLINSANINSDINTINQEQQNKTIELTDQFNNLTIPVNGNQTDNNTPNNVESNATPILNLTDGFNNLTATNNEPAPNNNDNGLEQFNNMLNNTSNTDVANTISPTTNNFNTVNEQNSFVNNGNGFSFLPNFDNPNAARDEFIKSSTGIILEEDKDNRDNLYLKVTEPSGREVIYTGKEAVRMIKNYNKVYLDANPGGRVDTSLIDSFTDV